MSDNLSRGERKRIAFLGELGKETQEYADKQTDPNKFLKQLRTIVALWRKSGPLYKLPGNLFCSNAASFFVGVVIPKVREFVHSEEEMEFISRSLEHWIPQAQSS